MSRTTYGTARRRTIVPADRHKRTVAYRHRPGNNLVSANEITVKETDAETQVIPETGAQEVIIPETLPRPAEEPAAEIPQKETESAGKEPAEAETQEAVHVSTAEPAESPVISVKTVSAPQAEEDDEEDDDEDEEEDDDSSLLERLSERRSARKREKKAQLDWEAELPHNGLFTMLLMPGTAIDRENTEEGPIFGSFASLLVNVIKWAVIGSVLVYPVYSYIRANEYSLISMNFTSAAKLAFELALFGFLGEYAVIWTLGFISNLMQRAIPKRKLVSSVSRGSLGVALAFGIVLVIMIRFGLAMGLAALIAAAVYSISLFEHGINGCMKLNKNLQLLILLLLVFAFALLGFKYIAYLAPDVLEMIQSIANL